MSERWFVIEGPLDKMNAITETPDGSAGALAYVGREDRDKHADSSRIAAAPEMEAVLREYRQWEADIIMHDEAWRTPTGEPRDIPRLSYQAWDRLMEIQRRREDVLDKVKGREV